MSLRPDHHDLLSVYAPQCGLSDYVKGLFYDHFRAVTAMIPALELLTPVQALVTKKFMEAMGMASQTLIVRVRGSMNMH